MANGNDVTIVCDQCGATFPRDGQWDAFDGCPKCGCLDAHISRSGAKTDERVVATGRDRKERGGDA